jgi:acetyl-CoA/propionyl-CoA carboxylase biotin carboxyl carrier protein
MRMLRALEEYVIEGPTTLVPFHRALLESACFAAGETCRDVVESEELKARVRELEHEAKENARLAQPAAAAASAADGAGTRERVLAVELDGRLHEVRVHVPEPPWEEAARRYRERRHGLASTGTDTVVSPMQGTVLQVEVSNGDTVAAGGVICIVEAMKMENPIVAHRDGVVAELGVAPGQQVASGDLICIVSTPDPA